MPLSEKDNSVSQVNTPAMQSGKLSQNSSGKLLQKRMNHQRDLPSNSSAAENKENTEKSAEIRPNSGSNKMQRLF